MTTELLLTRPGPFCPIGESLTPHLVKSAIQMGLAGARTARENLGLIVSDFWISTLRSQSRIDFAEQVRPNRSNRSCQSGSRAEA